MHVLFGIAIMLGVPAYLLLQAAAPFLLRDAPWKVASLLPLLFAVPIILWCLYALGQDSNLWPLPFILFAPLGAAYLAVVLAARWLTRTG
ncbi:MAG: hypothetical protein ABI697_04040 [Devosia sp.]